MIWKSLGIIFKPKLINSIKSHSWVPTAYKYAEDKVRVFFAGRDRQNHSNIYAFNISLKKPYRIIKISKEPILKKGELGYFDDSAAIPSHVIKIKNEYYLYYVGWTQGVTVPYISSIGLAKSKNLFGKFKKINKSPIFGRTLNDPIFVASCFVEKVKNGYQMFYTSNTKWKKINGRLVPKYFIKLATSNNAIDWKFKSNIMKFKSKNEIAISRPWVISCKKKKYLFYSYRGKNYQIGCAEVKRNNFLKRIDNNIRIKNYIDKFDNTMKEYASVIEYKNKLIMFYNGNNFGAEGIGIAEIEKDKIS
jgi:hypothetical protein